MRVYASKESQREAAECVMHLLQQQTAPGGPLPCTQIASEGEVLHRRNFPFTLSLLIYSLEFDTSEAVSLRREGMI